MKEGDSFFLIQFVLQVIQNSLRVDLSIAENVIEALREAGRIQRLREESTGKDRVELGSDRP